MPTLSPFSASVARLREFVNQSVQPGSSHDGESTFNLLALELFALQFAHNPAYRRFCEARGVSPDKIEHWSEIPAIPAVGFKELELTSLPPDQRMRVFHSSGTSEQRPSRHFHDAESLSLYEASLLPWFRAHLLDGWLSTDKISESHLIFLTPPPEAAPNSSLVHMFATIRRGSPSATSYFVGTIGPDGGWTVDAQQTAAILGKRDSADRPTMLLGTAFGFVHLLDWLKDQNIKLKLHSGSRVLETGGYKNRSRSMPKSELHSLIAKQLGILPANIVSEYGMSELSSQAYDAVAGTGNFAPRIFQFPPWARAQIISPETGREVGEGETGLIRLFDLANVRSVMAIQTEDLGIRRGGGFELLGRAGLAEPRGCSLMSR